MIKVTAFVWAESPLLLLQLLLLCDAVWLWAPISKQKKNSQRRGRDTDPSKETRPFYSSIVCAWCWKLHIRPTEVMTLLIILFVALISFIWLRDKMTRMTKLNLEDADEPQQTHLYSLGLAKGISNISFIVYHEKSTWLQYDYRASKHRVKV